MPESAQNQNRTSEPPGWFGTTHWSVVTLAGQQLSAEAEKALAKLCETYWYPLYVFVRRLGHTPEDAEDLVQGFFARLLEKNYVRAADREKGTFRSFLLLALNRYLANEWDRAKRLKRGGDRQIVSLDAGNTEMRYQSEPADELSPEKAFERRWAITTLEQVRRRLGNEMAAVGKGKLFEELQGFLSGGARESTWAELGRRLGMSEGSLKMSVTRLRQRYRELLRLEIANTVDSPEAINQEIRHLFAALD